MEKHDHEIDQSVIRNEVFILGRSIRGLPNRFEQLRRDVIATLTYCYQDENQQWHPVSLGLQSDAEKMSVLGTIAVTIDPRLRLFTKSYRFVFWDLFKKLQDSKSTITPLTPIRIQAPGDEKNFVYFKNVHSVMLQFISESKDDASLFTEYMSLLKTVAYALPLDLAVKKSFLEFVVSPPDSGSKTLRILTEIPQFFCSDEDYKILTNARDGVWRVLGQLNDNEPETIITLTKALDKNDPLGKLVWAKRNIAPYGFFSDLVPEPQENDGLRLKIKQKLERARLAQAQVQQISPVASSAPSHSIAPSLIVTNHEQQVIPNSRRLAAEQTAFIRSKLNVPVPSLEILIRSPEGNEIFFGTLKLGKLDFIDGTTFELGKAHLIVFTAEDYPNLFFAILAELEKQIITLANHIVITREGKSLRDYTIHEFMLTAIYKNKNYRNPMFGQYVTYLSQQSISDDSFALVISEEHRKDFLKFIVTGSHRGENTVLLLTKIGRLFVRTEDYAILTQVRDSVWEYLDGLDISNPETITILTKALDRNDFLGRLFWTKRRIDPFGVFTEYAPEQRADQGILLKIHNRLIAAKEAQNDYIVQV